MIKNNLINCSNVKRLIVVTLILSAFIALSAQDNNSLSSYMRMGVGARTIAMGDAGTATTSDVTAAYWNPAGLDNLKYIELSSMYRFNMNYDRDYRFVALGNHFNFGSLALTWVNASTSDIDGFDELDNPTGSFAFDEHNIGLSYANSFKGLKYGVTSKYYLSVMDGEAVSGYGFDLGLKYELSQYFTLGLMARDIISKIDDETVPYQVSLGVAAYPLLGITVTTEMKMEKAEDPTYCFGAEYWISVGKDNEANSKLTISSMKERNTWQEVLSDTQTGVRIGYDDGSFTAGTGIRLRNFQVDYVYKIINHDIFNDEHMISMTLRF